jgi:hypothetical protein
MKNVRFGPFSWAIAHDFRHPGQLLRSLPDFYQILVDDILWGFHWFWAIGYTFHAFYGPFRYLSSRKLMSTIPEDRMSHFVTLTVPPPCTDHSLRHITIRLGLRASRFRILWLREKRPFQAIFVSYNTRFSAPGSTFSKRPGFLANTYRSHLMRFQLVFGP